jgi:hypothetical protein
VVGYSFVLYNSVCLRDTLLFCAGDEVVDWEETEEKLAVVVVVVKEEAEEEKQDLVVVEKQTKEEQSEDEKKRWDEKGRNYRVLTTLLSYNIKFG